MNPRPFSQEDNHLALEVRGLSIIGFYFAHSSDLDTMILQLSEVISKTNDKSKILIGGDFNVKPHSQEHEEICKYLESEGIYQASDSNKSTFFHSKGSSTLDYIFGSHNMFM